MAAESKEANDILLTIDPYWHLFNYVLEYEPQPEINLTIRRTSQLPWIITKSYAYDRAFHHYPDMNMWTLPDPYWRLASYKFMHCDYSIINFLVYLEPALAKYGATVKWLTVIIRPYVLFHWQDKHPDALVRHSVFEITASSGNQYIADFTIEQFGYPSHMWFMEKRVYVLQCTLGVRLTQPGREEVAMFRRGDFGRPERDRDRVVREICNVFHFAWWRHEDCEKREAWLRSFVFRTWARYAGLVWERECLYIHQVLDAAPRPASDGRVHMILLDGQSLTADWDESSSSSSETAHGPHPVDRDNGRVCL